MRIFSKPLAVIIASQLVFAAMAQAQVTADKPVLQITVLDAHDDLQEYLARVKRTIARQHQVAPGIGTRIMQGTLAGSETRKLYLMLEYPSMKFLLDAHAKLKADPEWVRLQREAGMKRSIISDSLFADITP